MTSWLANVVVVAVVETFVAAAAVAALGTLYPRHTLGPLPVEHLGHILVLGRFVVAEEVAVGRDIHWAEYGHGDPWTAVAAVAAGSVAAVAEPHERTTAVC